MGRRRALSGGNDPVAVRRDHGRPCRNMTPPNYEPDGLEFEVCWIVPTELQTPEVEEGQARLRPLDIDAETERYGLQTVGGLTGPGSLRGAARGRREDFDQSRVRLLNDPVGGRRLDCEVDTEVVEAMHLLDV